VPSPFSRASRLPFVAGGLLAALALAAAVLLPYRPVVVAGAAAPPAPYTLPAAVPGLRLHVFNTGMNRMSALLVGEQRPWRPAPAFVLEHPSRGLLVFDTGLSPEVARDGEAALPIPMRWLFESRGRPGRTLDAQMREAGLDPAKAGTVVLSHLHDDHTGTVGAFAAANFVAGAGTGGPFDRSADRPASSWREIARADATTALLPFDGGLDLFADGSVMLIPGGGHAREDLMAMVALPGGPVLLAGDAVVHRDWLASDDVQRVAVDGERAAAIRNQVRALLAADPRVVLIPGHDLDGLPSGREDLVLHHAEWFEQGAWPVTP